MKNLLLFALLSLGMFTTSNAQIELKINPLGLLFNSPDIVAEYLATDDFGIEAGIGLVYGSSTLGITDLKSSGFSFLVAGKYYFNAEDGCDKFYAGAYLRPRTVKFSNKTDDVFDFGYKQSAVGLGLMLGYKWVSARGVTFELGLGLGRALGEKTTYNDETNTTEIPSLGFDGFGRLSVGYRLGGGK